MQNVLIITYYWPPSGGSGVQRWLKFANYLPENGWHPIILTPENPQFDLLDPSLEEEVDPMIEVLKLPIWEPYHLFNRLRGNKPAAGQGHTSMPGWAKFIRGNVFIPDPRVFWKKPVLRFMHEYLKTRQINYIITTGPPHSIHLIGKSLHKKYNIPWLADFRDPWSTWDMLDQFGVMAPVRALHRRLERKVVQSADVVLTVSGTWAAELQDMYGRDVAVIPNGFDPSDFPVTDGRQPDKFVMAHFGLLNAFRYDPVFWQVLDDLAADQPQFAESLEIRLYGNVDQDVADKLHRYSNLSGRIMLMGTVSHQEVVKAYQEAAVLLLFMNNSSNAAGHIPGKLFEYLAARRPVLALGDPSGDTAGILSKTNAGDTIAWGNTGDLNNTIMRRFRDFMENRDLLVNEEALKAYTRQSQTSRLARLMDSDEK